MARTIKRIVKKRNKTNLTKKSFAKKMAISFISLIVILIILELALSFTDINVRLLEKNLFYQALDAEVYKLSDNPERLYELLPNSSMVSKFEIHPKETKYDQRQITINSLGFRDKERNKTKPEGVYRIIVLGRSPEYGASVSDEDTYPVIMDRLLNEKYPGKYEVWNAGISAYTATPIVELAREVISVYEPDLLIMPDDRNWKYRRAFLYGKDPAPYFRQNRDLYAENIPLMLSENPDLKSLHFYLVRYSGIYRFVMININNFVIESIKNEIYEGNKCVDISLYIKLDHKISEFAAQINKNRVQEFLDETKSQRKIIVIAPYLCGKNGNQLKLTEEGNTTSLIYCPPGMPDEYYDAHPPSYVNKWFAEKLVKVVTGLKLGIPDSPDSADLP